MNIKELINSDANIQIVVNALDLKEFALEIIEETLAQAKNAKKEEKYLTVDEVGKILKTTKSTLWRWNKTGYLKTVKVGYKVFIVKAILKNLWEATYEILFALSSMER